MIQPRDSQESNGRLQLLSGDECFELLATQPIGRLGVNDDRYPLIFPVNFALDGRVIVIRTGPGTKLTHASHANVTFEVDSFNPETRSGWSVLIRGLAEELTAEHRPELVERTLSAGVDPWASGTRAHWLRLIPQAVTGRRIIPGDLPDVFAAS